MTRRWKPTDKDRETIRQWVVAGIPLESVAKALGIKVETLQKYTQDIIDNAMNEANVAVAGVAYQMAVSGVFPAMTTFWLKTRMRWRETDRLELTGADGGPLTVEVGSHLTDEQKRLIALRALSEPDEGSVVDLQPGSWSTVPEGQEVSKNGHPKNGVGPEG